MSVILDEKHLTAALKASLNADERENAENYLSAVSSIIGYTPTLLKIVVDQNQECPVRQAGIILLKNLISAHWNDDDQEKSGNDAKGALIHEQDRHLIRECIVEAIINCPEVIRLQLAVCVSRIIKNDFPHRWPQVVEKIVQNLDANKTCQNWMGALVVLYQLVKAYEFKKPEEREVLVEAMKHISPLLYARMTSLMQDQSQEACYLQKFILKIFYALVQFTLNLNLLTIEEFAQWMNIVHTVVERPVPAETLNVDEEDRPNLVFWKCKKWASRTMSRIFERYGNPGQVAAEYNQFAENYLKNFVSPALHVVLKVLEEYRSKSYVSPPVLYQILNYLQSAVAHSFSWKLLKAHMLHIITEIVFPLSCHTDADEELWQSDPQEYVRVKYDLLSELVDPTSAAVALLSESVKRKDLLNKTIQFLGGVLINPQSSSRQLDGALHMLGTLAPNLLKKKIYKESVEASLVTHVFPRFQSRDGFLRARACWCLQMFSETHFNNEENLHKALQLVLHSLLNPQEEMPVKVEAAMALQILLNDQPKLEKLVEPQIKDIILTLIKLIRETENDDLTNVVQRLIGVYTLQVTPIALEISQELAQIFTHILQNDDGAEDRAIAAIGVLNTLEVVMDAVEDFPEITSKLEEIIIYVINTIVKQEAMEFFEEAFILMGSLMVKQISDRCWPLLDLLYDIFKNQAGVDYFTDMMPCLHSFLTVDPDKFLSQPNRLEMIFDMCRMILNEDVDDDTQCHAAKLLEVLILQFKSRLDPVIRPICEIVLGRLVKEIKSSELRTMCLQVLIAALHYNAQLFLQILSTFQSPDASMPLLDLFVKQWLCDTDCFLGLHDRKMCLIGLTTLMAMPDRPKVLFEMSQNLLPSCLTLYQGLQKAYELKAQRENEQEDEDSGEEEEIDEEALNTDEDEMNDEGQQYLHRLAKSEKDSGNDEDFSDDGDSSDFAEETDLESYETLLDGEEAEVDEYIFFKDTLQNLERAEPSFYQMLIGCLTDEHKTGLIKVFTTADQRRAARESKRIEQTGGYQFQISEQQAPMNFNFGDKSF